MPNSGTTKRSIELIIMSSEYNKAKSSRNQILVLYRAIKKIKEKTSYQDIAELCDETPKNRKFHIYKAHKEQKGHLKNNMESVLLKRKIDSRVTYMNSKVFIYCAMLY